MTSLWWLALPVLALPIWWHRRKLKRADALPLATARFLPRTDPLQQRVWRWTEHVLLLVRCLLLVTVIAWLADLVQPWRGDTVLLAPGTDKAWAAQQAKQAGFPSAEQIVLASRDVFGWLAKHEREWKPGARILIAGNVPMPAAQPAMAHEVIVRSRPAPAARSEQRVAIVSKRAARWSAMFSALDGPQRYVVTTEPDAKTELIIWDMPEAPPVGLRAPLWWIGDAAAFPELSGAAAVDGVRYADSPQGRLWTSAAWPAADPEAARKQFETWQRQHYPPAPYTTPSQVLAATAGALQASVNGALRYFFSIALITLFALERILSHAKRR